MSNIKDIAKIIAKKHQLPSADAEIFMQKMVEVINEGLLTDRIVKIKGFGTFKLQSVKDRSSINVNTGERVVIAGHDKVTFTPDILMKDVINRPFAQFETVILNDDVPIDSVLEADNEAESTEENLSEIDEYRTEPTEDEPDTTEKAGEDATFEKADRKDEADIVEESLNIVDLNSCDASAEDEGHNENEPEILINNENVSTDCAQDDKRNNHAELDEADFDENDDDIVEGVDECPAVKRSCRNYFIYVAVLINILVAAAAFFAGYYVAKKENVAIERVQPVKPKKTVHRQVSQKVVTRDTSKNAAVRTDSIKPKTLTADSIAVLKKKEVADEMPLDQYNIDPRVRTGAYVITGVAETVTLKNGQTMQSIARRMLGPEMECYVEAINGKKDANVGDKIKIPKLILKKRLKRQ